MTTDPDPRNDPRSVGTLLSDLVQQMTTLFRTETNLLKTELRENLSKFGTGAMEIAAGAVILLVALLVLVTALVAALAELIGPVWASLLVGIVLAVIGAILVRRGSTNVSPSSLAPERTAHQLQKDVQVAKEKV